MSPRAALVATLRAWVNGLKLERGCQRCGEHDPRVLDYHHRDPRGKLGKVSRAIKDRWSRARIRAEIRKCDLLCANCHRREHAR